MGLYLLLVQALYPRRLGLPAAQVHILSYAPTRKYHKGVPACSQRNPTKWYRKCSSYQTCQGEQKEWSITRRNIPGLAKQCHCISTYPKIDSMTERNIPGISRKDIPSNCCCGEKQGKDRDCCGCRVRKYKWKCYECSKKGNEQDYSEYFHCFLPSGCPKSPCGRITRTVISTMKKTVLDHTGDHTTAVTSPITSKTTEAIKAPLKLPSPPRTIITSKREIRS